MRGTRIGAWLTHHFRYHAEIEGLLREYPGWIIFLSSLASGLGVSTVILAGWSGISYWTFFRAASAAGATFAIVFVILGFFMNSALDYLKAAKYIGRLEFGVLAFIVLIFLLQYLARRSITKRLGSAKDQKAQ